MKRPEIHYATDRRVYNGALCSDLQREAESKDNIRKKILEKYPKFRTCHFPQGGGWLAHLCYDDVSGNFHHDLGDCLLEAWDILIGNTTNMEANHGE